MVKKGQRIFGVYEWAVKGLSIYRGCPHDCLYCYAKSQAIKYHNLSAESWKHEQLIRDYFYQAPKLYNGQVMFPHLHDIHAENVDTCLAYLEPLLKIGNKVLVVSKPAPDVVKELCRRLAPWKAQVLYRFTIGSYDNEVLAYWEPNAPTLLQRIEALALADGLGYQTSVSMEPMLDGEPWRLVEAIRKFTSHSVWLGTANFLANRLATNTTGQVYEDATRKAVALARVQTNTWVRNLYEHYRGDSLVRWKDSIKRLVGLPSPVAPGLDI